MAEIRADGIRLGQAMTPLPRVRVALLWVEIEAARTPLYGYRCDDNETFLTALSKK